MLLKFKRLLTEYQWLRLYLTFAFGFLVFSVSTKFCAWMGVFPDVRIHFALQSLKIHGQK